MTLKNKTALITGASRGLGKKIAQLFWREGVNLILVARTLEKLEELRDELQVSSTFHQKINIIKADLADQNDFIKIMDSQRVDILINNAAIQGPIGSLWENDWKSWQETVQVNLLSPVALCRAVVPQMIKNNFGKIINVSGGGATSARPKFSAYAVSKAGLVRFSETLAEEVKPFNISVNCIAPGMMNTDMLQEILQAGEEIVGIKEFQQVKQKTKDDHAIIECAAELCVYLASLNGNDI